MNRKCKAVLRTISYIILVISALNHHALAKPDLTVAISLDIPPYVMDQATSGLEVDIVRLALPDYTLRFIQLPYADLQKVVPQKGADVAVGVQVGDKSVFYSDNFITFANYAISKKADGLKIMSISDLKDHRILTWQGAYLELGSEFEHLFSPLSPQSKNYTEIADQREQVQMFWQNKDDIIVIDRSIFHYFTTSLGYSMDQVHLHPYLPSRYRL